MSTKFSLRDSHALRPVVAHLVESRLESGEICFVVTRESMLPAFAPGDQVIVRRVRATELTIGDIVLMKTEDAWLAHRLIARRSEQGQLKLVTKGDNATDAETPWNTADLVGVVAAVRRHGRVSNWRSAWARVANACRALRSRGAMSARRIGALALAAWVLTMTLPIPRAAAAVTVSSFSAQGQTTQVQVTWTTANEIGNAGFNLLRSNSADGTYAQINPALIRSQCLGCISGANYSYTDSAITPGQTYYYKLQSVDTRGGLRLYGPVSSTVSIPTATPTVSSTPSCTSTRAANSATPPLPSTTAPSPRAPIAIVLPTRGATNPSPQTKVALAITGGPSTPSRTSSGTRVALNAQPSPLAASALSPIAVVVESSAEENAAEMAPSVSAPAHANAQPRASAGVFGLAGTFGCGSLIFAALAVALFVRINRLR